MTKKYLSVLVLLVVAGCESERRIPTRTHPNGEVIRCVGLDQRGKRAGIDYEVSDMNIVVGVVGIELIAPPIIVALHEVYCPLRDTTSVRP